MVPETQRPLLWVLLFATVIFGMGADCGVAPQEARGTQLFESPQADPIALSADGSQLYVVNTVRGSLEVIDTATRRLSFWIEVGVDPVSVAVRPDGSEVWVANHVSDSISVVDVAAGSPTRFHVIETIQSVDVANLITDFDEPVGIAFASNAKAYVALSSRNQIAVVDANSYTVTNFLAINAQEPRALRVRNGRLFVPAFESGNRSELSACATAPDPSDPQCTFNFTQANAAQNPNLVGFPVDIAKDPFLPDRDLYVFNTTTDALQSVVSGIGTLLYGVAVSSAGQVFITQTDARNADNGRAGTQGQGLADLDNRIFLNQIGRVSCPGASCGAPSLIQLEPLPPANPAAGFQLATPYAIQLSNNDATIVATAAASSRVFTLNAATGQLLDVLDVGNGPRGLALRSHPTTGAPLTAYVLNTLDGTVSVVDVSNPASLAESMPRISLRFDGAPDAIRRGRIAFNSAAASTTGTFSCTSCHPDGHVDQLLWVIGAECTFSGCNQEEPRNTMPVRGLRGTLPLHWDGSLGDPFGGPSGEVRFSESLPPNCTNDQSCFRHLVNASLGGVMCDQGACPQNDVGQAGSLGNAEREDMATYLQNISYPPARSRRFDDFVTVQGINGFSDFFQNKGGVNPPGPGGAGPETCADAAGGCHALPHGTSSNSIFVGAFESPTMRGITDRVTEFSGGFTNVRDLLGVATLIGGTEAPWSTAIGFDEFTVWALAFGSPTNNIGFRQAYNVRAFNIFQMIEEMSTGHSGALGRQVTLNQRTTAAGERVNTEAVLARLEDADLGGAVNLTGTGIRGGQPIQLGFQSGGTYQGLGLTLTRAALIAEASAGTLVLTLTAAQRSAVNPATVQPTLSVPSVGNVFSDGRLALPVLGAGNPAPFTVQGRDITAGPTVWMDGDPVSASVTCVGGTFSPTCTSGQLSIDLLASPTTTGLHLLQVQNPGGLFSNELPVVR